MMTEDQLKQEISKLEGELISLNEAYDNAIKTAKDVSGYAAPGVLFNLATYSQEIEVKNTILKTYKSVLNYVDKVCEVK